MMAQAQTSRGSPTNAYVVYSMLRFLAHKRRMENMIDPLISTWIPALSTMATVLLKKESVDSPNVQHEAVRDSE